MDNIDYLVVRLCFLLGWTFDYSCEFIKKTPVKKVRAFIDELEYQKSVEDYRLASNAAMIITIWANAQSKKRYRVTDFIGPPPQRKISKEKLVRATEGIITLPKGDI